MTRFLDWRLQRALLVTSVLMTLVLSASAQDKSHIPVGSSSMAAAGQSAIRFTFSRVDNNINWILPNLTVVNHIYTVYPYSGYIKVYLKSETFTPDEYLRLVNLEGTSFGCSYIYNGVDFSSVRTPYGTIVNFLSHYTRLQSEDIPETWYNGNFIVLSIFIPTVLPINTAISIRCGLDKKVSVLASEIDVKVVSNATVRRVGCPRNRWGTKCSLPCMCQNGGECHTFRGHCICPEHYNGTLCQTDLRCLNSSEPCTTTTTTTTTTTPSTTSSSITVTKDGQSVQDDDPKNQADSIFRKQFYVLSLIFSPFMYQVFEGFIL